MESTGTRLKHLRLQKGLSLEDMQKKTKIHLNILKAIEEDSLINFSPIYIKGFIKIYCQELNVDPKDYLSDYKEQHRVGGSVVSGPLPKTTIKVHFGILRAISSKFKLPRIPVKAIIIISLIAAVSFLLFKLGKFVAVRYTLHMQKARMESIVTDKKEAQKQKTVSPASKKTLPKEQRGEVAALTPNSSSLRLGISAKEDCWLHLKVDGKIVFWSTLKKGKSESWQAKEKIELSLGNAAAVVMEINNKVLPALGRKGQPIKNMVITKDGWSVPR